MSVSLLELWPITGSQCIRPCPDEEHVNCSQLGCFCLSPPLLSLEIWLMCMVWWHILTHLWSKMLSCSRMYCSFNTLLSWTGLIFFFHFNTLQYPFSPFQSKHYIFSCTLMFYGALSDRHFSSYISSSFTQILDWTGLWVRASHKALLGPPFPSDA